MNKNTLAIIRSVGERTTGLVEYACRKELDDVRVIRDMSLSDSTRELCTQAVDSGKKWVLMIGGDYIPKPGFIAELYRVARTVPEAVMFVKGVIRDKFLMELRGDGGGPMLQRVDLLGRWLEAYDRIDNGRTTEAQFHKFLAHKGYRSERTKIYLAMHDFEQHNRDIYRSCFVYGKKRRDAIRLYRRWEELATTDRDFLVALAAHKAGTRYNGKVMADFTKDYGFDKSVFADWSKPDIDTSDYEALIQKAL